MTSGIYLITNKINGHMYVGGSVDIEKRFNEHKRYKDFKNSAIDRAIKKYGAEKFTYQIITELPADWKIIGEHEKYWIKFYNTFNEKKHYNWTKGGDNSAFGKSSPNYRDDIDTNVLADEYFNNSLNTYEIGEKYNISAQMVHSRLTKAGYKLKEVSGKNHPGYRDDLDNEIMKDLYENKNLTIQEIADRFNVSYTCARNHLIENNTRIKNNSEVNTGKNNPNWNRHHTEEEKERMRENSGMRGKTGERHPKYRNDVPSGEELFFEKEKTGSTNTELAQKYNCGRKLIGRRIIEYKKENGING